MRVVYDGSVLAESMHDLVRRTGIHRAVAELASALARRDDIELSLSAMRGWNRVHQLEAYASRHGDLRDTPVVRSTGSRARLVERVLRPTASAPGSRERPHLQRLANLVHRGLAAAAPTLSADALRGADVFHAPAYDLPRPHGASVTRFVTVYDLIAEMFPQFGSPKTRAAIRAVRRSVLPRDFIICDSQATKEDVVREWSIEPERIFVAHLAASPELFHVVRDPDILAAARRRYAIPEGNYVLSVNALDARKNVQLAIRSFVRMVRQQRLDDLYLVLVWNRAWDARSLFDSVDDVQLARERVVITGYVDDADLAAIYSGALYFVFPSYYEGFGLPALEAMQCGLPVIASNTSSLPEVIGAAGMLVDPGDEERFSAAMLELLTNDDRRRLLGEAGLERARAFTWDRTADRVVSAYRAGRSMR